MKNLTIIQSNSSTFIMKVYVYFGVILFAVMISAKPHATIKESSISSQTDFSKIINGSPASEGIFPYMVYIRGLLPCGGVLISPSWVLTEAYCITGPTTASVYIGSVDNTTPLITIMTQDLRPHPLFNMQTLENNIGLINLVHSVIFGPTIDSIALPRQSQAFANFGSGRTATILGWGQVEISGPVNTNILHFGTVSIISNDACRLTEDFYIYNTTLCAVPVGQTSQNVCAGDWGGPLVLRDVADIIDIVAGITSRQSFDGCISGRPSFFVRPQHYWDWINSQTGIPIRY